MPCHIPTLWLELGLQQGKRRLFVLSSAIQTLSSGMTEFLRIAQLFQHYNTTHDASISSWHDMFVDVHNAYGKARFLGDDIWLEGTHIHSWEESLNFVFEYQIELHSTWGLPHNLAPQPHLSYHLCEWYSVLHVSDVLEYSL